MDRELFAGQTEREGGGQTGCTTVVRAFTNLPNASIDKLPNCEILLHSEILHHNDNNYHFDSQKSLSLSTQTLIFIFDIK